MPKAKHVDLERCATASSKQSDSCQPSLSSINGRHCAIAVQHLDGRAVLIDATVKENVDGGLIFNSAKKQIFQALGNFCHQRLAGKLFMGLIVGTARIKQVIPCGPRPRSPGHQGSQSRVYLQDFTLDTLLTEALHNPDLLLRSEAYPFNVDNSGSLPADNNPALGHQPARSSNNIDDKPTSTCIEHDDPDVIVVRRVIDRAKVAWLLILLLFFSPALGIAVGICFHNADVGIAVSAGVFALASFVQGLAAWVQG